MPRPVDVFAALEGSWTIERVLRNHAGPSATATGSATISFGQEGAAMLRYDEAVAVRWENGTWGAGKQSYIYTRGEKTDGRLGNSLKQYEVITKHPAIFANAQNAADAGVANEEAKLMYELSFDENGRWTGEYGCGPDYYFAEFKFTGEDDLQIIYDVRGPNKNYKSTTTYRRAPVAAQPQPVAVAA